MFFSEFFGSFPWNLYTVRMQFADGADGYILFFILLQCAFIFSPAYLSYIFRNTPFPWILPGLYACNHAIYKRVLNLSTVSLVKKRAVCSRSNGRLILAFGIKRVHVPFEKHGIDGIYSKKIEKTYHCATQIL